MGSGTLSLKKERRGFRLFTVKNLEPQKILINHGQGITKLKGLKKRKVGKSCGGESQDRLREKNVPHSKGPAKFASVSFAQLCLALCDSTRVLCPWNSPGKNTGVGCHFFLQKIFPIQGSNLRFLHCRHILYHLKHQG